MYGYTIYEITNDRPRAEEGQRRAADPVADREPAPARLRHQQTDRVALTGRLELSRCVALPAPLPAGETRLDPGPMGGEGRTTAATLLQTDAHGEKDPRSTAQHLGSVRGGDQPHHQRRTCLKGRFWILDFGLRRSIDFGGRSGQAVEH